MLAAAAQARMCRYCAQQRTRCDEWLEDRKAARPGQAGKAGRQAGTRSRALSSRRHPSGWWQRRRRSSLFGGPGPQPAHSPPSRPGGRRARSIGMIHLIHPPIHPSIHHPCSRRDCSNLNEPDGSNTCARRKFLQLVALCLLLLHNSPSLPPAIAPSITSPDLLPDGAHRCCPATPLALAPR